MSNAKKIILIILILAGAGVLLWSVVWLVGYYQYRNSPQYQAQKYLDEMEKKYREDTYGGNTPEETLQLFIDALKKGDTDLASKYFVVEKQEEWRGKLEVGKKNDTLTLLIKDLEKEKFGNKLSDNRYRFSTYDKNNVAEFSFDLIVNPFTNKWKIESL